MPSALLSLKRRIRLQHFVRLALIASSYLFTVVAVAQDLDRDGMQWTPAIEWTLENPSHRGNPFDLVATATFAHEESGETRTTGMFHDGENRWKFRFTGTRTGRWTFTTKSDDPELDARRGTVTIRPNPDPNVKGFVAGEGNKWIWTHDGSAFVPQLVMYAELRRIHGRPDKIDADIKTFLVEHGFNGFHVTGSCHWFDLNKTGSDEIDTPNPDPRTFEALETLIVKTHRAGGMVHFWMWGDESRRFTPKRWGLNGEVDRRLQRYLAARLGPLPGWTVGYGFDLDEWVEAEDLRRWHDHLHAQLGWSHLMGGRDGGPNRGLDHRDCQIDESLDYSGYEHHRPDYRVYRAAIADRPHKPSLSEDRFRIRQSRTYREKDYDMQRTRRGLWHSTMAGGVANIWGHLPAEHDFELGSAPYPRPEWIKTYSEFFRGRFLNGMQPEDDQGDGTCLTDTRGPRRLFYKEDTESIEYDLSGLGNAERAVAVDTLKPYQEIDLGRMSPEMQRWRAPYRSDWSIAVGDFRSGRP